MAVTLRETAAIAAMDQLVLNEIVMELSERITNLTARQTLGNNREAECV